MTQTLPSDNTGATKSALSIDEARRLIADNHHVVVGNDDPILMAVTLHRAFMLDLEAVLKRLNSEAAAGIAEIIARTKQETETSTLLLREELLKGVAQSVLSGVAEQAIRFGQLKQLVRSLLIALSCFTAAIWLAVIAFFFILK